MTTPDEKVDFAAGADAVKADLLSGFAALVGLFFVPLGGLWASTVAAEFARHMTDRGVLIVQVLAGIVGAVLTFLVGWGIHHLTRVEVKPRVDGEVDQ